MAKIIVWNIVSLDGYFEGPEKWDLALHEYVWGPELERLSVSFGEDMGLLVFGRVTYEGMAEYWPNAADENTADENAQITAYMNAAPKLVASRTLESANWQNTEVTADIVGSLTARKAADQRPIYVFGSAELTDSLLQAGLVDELLIAISPVILGAGTPLFKAADAPRQLELLESKALETGGVLIRYAVPRGA